ncbi:MAG: hypothetical protein NC910_03640, partial [Candidatus Omnitrophica bacterium]|nr:hypothetical protein [Candidatus Omnitrophota bacterium]
ALHAARRELPQQIADARADVARRRAEALEELARQKGLALNQILAQITQARTDLTSQYSSLENQLRQMESTNVRGRSAKRAKSMKQMQVRSVGGDRVECLLKMSLQEEQ